jgi:hypothetical protein
VTPAMPIRSLTSKAGKGCPKLFFYCVLLPT